MSRTGTTNYYYGKKAEAEATRAVKAAQEAKGQKRGRRSETELSRINKDLKKAQKASASFLPVGEVTEASNQLSVLKKHREGTVELGLDTTDVDKKISKVEKGIENVSGIVHDLSMAFLKSQHAFVDYLISKGYTDEQIMDMLRRRPPVPLEHFIEFSEAVVHERRLTVQKNHGLKAARQAKEAAKQAEEAAKQAKGGVSSDELDPDTFSSGEDGDDGDDEMVAGSSNKRQRQEDGKKE